MAEDIARILERIGYSYFKLESTIKIDGLITNIIIEHEPRFIKAIPFVIYLSEKKEGILFDIDELLRLAKEKNISEQVKAILFVTAKIVRITDDQNKLLPELNKIFSRSDENILDSIFYSQDYKQFNKKIKVADNKLVQYKKKIAEIYFNFDEFLYEFISQKTLLQAKIGRAHV